MSPSPNADEGQVVVVNYEGELRNLDTGKKLAQLEGVTGASLRLAIFSPDADRILTAENGLGVRLHDRRSGREILRLHHPCLDVAQCDVVGGGRGHHSRDGEDVGAGAGGGGKRGQLGAADDGAGLAAAAAAGNGHRGDEQALDEAIRQMGGSQNYRLKDWKFGYIEASGNVAQEQLTAVYQFSFEPMEEKLALESPPRMVQVAGVMDQ